jgi:pimeloyl-ACP methyl ester carboxylesterase
VLETLDTAGVRHAAFIGHSFGGRLLLELAALDRERVDRAVLLDPAIQILPHVGYDFAERERVGRTYSSPDEAIAAKVAETGSPRAYVEDDVREHLVQSPDGSFRFRCCQSTVVSVFGELCTPAPPAETLRVATLLLYANAFGLVREEQVEAYRAALGDLLEVIVVPGGHVVYWDAYEVTADAVEAFLAR